MKRPSLPRIARFILFLNAAGLFALAVGVLILAGAQRALIAAREDALRVQAEAIALVLAEAVPPTAETMTPRAARDVLLRFAELGSQRIMVFDAQGNLVTDSELLRDDVVDSPLPPPGEGGVAFREVRNVIAGILARISPDAFVGARARARAEGRTLAQDVSQALRGQSSAGVRLNERGELLVSVTLPVRRVQLVMGAITVEQGGVGTLIAQQRQALLPFFVMALGIGIVTVVLLSIRVAAPVRRLARAADQVRPGSTAASIPDLSHRKDEIGDLSASLRAMTNSLYDRIEAIEAFAADVAHELKNPLTSLRSAVDTLPLAKTEAQRERLMELARDDVARIDRLITDISNASRLDAELSRTGNDVINLSALLKSVASHAQAQTAEPDEGGVHILTSDLPDRAFVRGHGEALGRIFHNLLDNARSFSPPGGTILLSTTKEDRDWVVRIKDEGPGIPEDALEQIFERFYTHRPGHTAFGQHSGLGLSIVRQIVEAHGGSVSASNAEDGGAVFTVRLPRQGLTAARKDTSPRGHGMA